MKHLLARSSFIICSFWPSRFNISVMRTLNKILLSTEQLKAISATVNRKAPCKLLVFGLGNDSKFWSSLNRGGVTFFIEDNKFWFQRITKRSKDIKAFPVNYDSKVKDWKAFLEDTSLLNMNLPSDVEKEEWDVILVDGPAGWCDENPGRMKSIFLSSKLVKSSGDIFVHDCNRKIEDIYCNKFLKKDNLKLEINAPAGLLRHYHMTNRSS